VGIQEDAAAAAARHIEANGRDILVEFLRFVGMPNVSADLEDVRVVADAITKQLIRRGVSARLLERDGAAPLVTGRIDAGPGKPTIGIYAHYDGQPVDQEG
jgi:acetylornithine deacetylase/succinyl-diaminopimelate desuccinylase-like protein